MEYNYVRCMAADTNQVIAHYAEQGWKVHTFIRLPAASVVDILFEREEADGRVQVDSGVSSVRRGNETDD